MYYLRFLAKKITEIQYNRDMWHKMKCLTTQPTVEQIDNIHSLVYTRLSWQHALLILVPYGRF